MYKRGYQKQKNIYSSSDSLKEAMAKATNIKDLWEMQRDNQALFKIDPTALKTYHENFSRLSKELQKGKINGRG